MTPPPCIVECIIINKIVFTSSCILFFKPSNPLVCLLMLEIFVKILYGQIFYNIYTNELLHRCQKFMMTSCPSRETLTSGDMQINEHVNGADYYHFKKEVTVIYIQINEWC